MVGQGSLNRVVDVLSERLNGMLVRRIHVGPHAARITSQPCGSVVTVEPSGIVSDLGEPSITAVETLGNKTSIAFSNRVTLIVHDSGQAAWYRYHPAAQWRKPAFRLTVAIWTDYDAFACIDAASVEFVHSDQTNWGDGHRNKSPVDASYSNIEPSSTARLWRLRRAAGG